MRGEMPIFLTELLPCTATADSECYRFTQAEIFKVTNIKKAPFAKKGLLACKSVKFFYGLTVPHPNRPSLNATSSRYSDTAGFGGGGGSFCGRCGC